MKFFLKNILNGSIGLSTFSLCSISFQKSYANYEYNNTHPMIIRLQWPI